MTKEKEQKKPEKKVDKKTKKLQGQIESLEKEKAELFEKLQRVSADYVNYQKRASKQITDSITYEKEVIIKSLLPALDNFEHTLAAEEKTEDIETLVKGVRIIYEQMLTIMKSHGVEQIETLGETFDPAMHEAMMQRSEPEKEDNIVLEEFQKGYKLNGRVIRPGKVIVNKQPAEQDKQGDEE
jgi:molecular chaperone GrpE